MENYNYFQNGIKQYLQLVQLKEVEKDVIQVLDKLLNLFLSFFAQDKDKSRKNLKGNFTDSKKNLLEFLINKGYSPSEFHILKYEIFNNHLEYLSILMKNLCYYLDKYDFVHRHLNLYYYLFHLIYFILTIVIKSKDKIMLSDNIIKFYIFHIIHFFQNDEKTPESIYFFYHGAFKQLKKRYNIETKYVINFAPEGLNFVIPYTIEKILNQFKIEKSNSCNSNELEFLDNFSNFKKNVYEINQGIGEIYYLLPQNDSDRFKNLFEEINNNISKIINILEKSKVKCERIENYQKLIIKSKDLISQNHITKNDLILMELNYRKIPENDNKSYEFDIEKYISLAEFFQKCEKDSDEDYSEIFKQIINSEKFKTLYYEAMNSAHIRNFIEELYLNEMYQNFMDNFARKIDEFILYVPLTRGIKAYVSNYFRIALNINSIEICGEFDKDSKKEFLTSYLLIQLLQESLHFIYRLDKEGKNSKEGISPKREKIKESYEDIGVDLILYVFGTEYINFISKKNSRLICDIESWKNPKTNFKVFNKIYLSGKKLENEKDKEIDTSSGLKCDISLEYEYYDSEDIKICTDEVIKYCF